MNYKIVNIETGTVVTGQDYFVQTTFGREIMRSYNNVYPPSFWRASVNNKYKLAPIKRSRIGSLQKRTGLGTGGEAAGSN